MHVCAVQAVYFDRTYHNETTARLWWDDHKAFFDTREQLIQHVLVSGRRTLKKVASRLRRSRAASVSSGPPLPPSPWRGSHLQPPGDFAVATEATADLPLGLLERPLADEAGMYPYSSAEGSGPQPRAGERSQASQIFTDAQAFVAQQSNAAAQDVRPYADDAGDHRYDDGGGDAGTTGGATFQPPSQPLI